MNNQKKLVKISAIKMVLESMTIDKIRTKIWESDNKFSNRYKLSKIVEDETGYATKLNKLPDEIFNIMHDIFVTNEILHPKHFKTKENTAEFLSYIVSGYIDVTKIDDNIISGINGVCESIKKEYPDYNPNDETTWGSNYEISDMYHKLYLSVIEDKNMVFTDKNIQLFTTRKKIFESMITVKEDKKDLYSMIYDVLDENSIVLLNSFIFSTMETYSDDMRDKIFKYLKDNPDSPAVDMVVGDITDTDIKALSDQFSYYDAQSFITNKSFLGFRKNKQGNICLIKYAGKNNYRIKEIN